MARLNCDASVASAAMAIALRAPASRQSLARSSTVARVRATTATEAPSLASATAAAPPSPRPAPSKRVRQSLICRSIRKVSHGATQTALPWEGGGLATQESACKYVPSQQIEPTQTEVA